MKVTIIIGLKVDLYYKSTCITSLIIGGSEQALNISISLNPSKLPYLNLSEYFDQEKIAEKLLLLEMPLIQVEGFLNLK